MKLIDMTITEFIDVVDSKSPAPGGGSVAALSSELGIALARMVAHLSFGKKKYESLDEKIRIKYLEKFNALGDIRQEMEILIDKDSESFNEFMKAIKMPKDSEKDKENREIAMKEATKLSIEVPLKVANLSSQAIELIKEMIEYGNKNAVTDIGVGVLMLYSGIEGAILNVRVNLNQLEKDDYRENKERECNKIISQAKINKDNILETVYSMI